MSYSATVPQACYVAVLTSLGLGAGIQTCSSACPAVANGCFIDAVLALVTKSVCGFAALGQNPVGGANTSFTSGAVPVTYNQTGTREFCAFEDGVLRQLPPAAGNTGGQAAAAALAGAGGPATCPVAPRIVLQ